MRPPRLVWIVSRRVSIPLVRQNGATPFHSRSTVLHNNSMSTVCSVCFNLKHIIIVEKNDPIILPYLGRMLFLTIILIVYSVKLLNFMYLNYYFKCISKKVDSNCQIADLASCRQRKSGSEMVWVWTIGLTRHPVEIPTWEIRHPSGDVTVRRCQASETISSWLEFAINTRMPGQT